MTCGWDEMFSSVKVAAVNFVPWKWHRDWNADRLEMFFTEAAGCGAELVVAPEGILEGYVANEAVHVPELRKDMLAVAEPIDGPYVERFRKLAGQLKAALVFGMAERRGTREVYNTALFIDASGGISGVYSKMQLAEGHKKSWSFNRLGKRIRAFDTPLGRCGMLICNDRWNPALARTLALDGARLLCIPSYGNRSKAQDEAVLARARENGIPIVLANVGRNLIISKGEIVALDARTDAVTIAEIEIPTASGRQAARALEKRFLTQRPALMAERLRQTLDKSEEYRRTHAHQGRPPKPRKKAVLVHDRTKGTRHTRDLNRSGVNGR